MDWMLPKAIAPEDSTVLLLDWYSGHRAPEVEALVKEKGHVLLFHGGGTTAFTQVNDTHLHAAYQHLQVSSEVEWTHQERLEALAAGRDRTPVQTRENIVALNRMVWELLPHERLAAIGYKQTGPGLPMEGPWRIEDFGKELGKVLRDLDPDARPGEVGTTIRDEAIAFIRSGWGSQWSAWKDAYEVLQEHDDEDAPVDEGLEGWGYAYEDSDDSGGENDDGDDGPGGGGGGQGGPGGAAAQMAMAARTRRTTAAVTLDRRTTSTCPRAAAARAGRGAASPRQTWPREARRPRSPTRKWRTGSVTIGLPRQRRARAPRLAAKI